MGQVLQIGAKFITNWVRYYKLEQIITNWGTTVIYNDYNYNLVDNGIFPDFLKTANVTPVFKKGSRTDKKNYRPVSILQFSNNIMSKFQCGFRKGFNAQDCLIVMIEKWKRMLDKGRHLWSIIN